MHTPTAQSSATLFHLLLSVQARNGLLLLSISFSFHFPLRPNLTSTAQPPAKAWMCFHLQARLVHSPFSVDSPLRPKLTRTAESSANTWMLFHSLRFLQARLFHSPFS